MVYDGYDGPGKGKHIVLISGDEEYRSEEALPQLGKILAKRHGFKCTVLFAVDPATGTIDPKNLSNIPGLEALKTADLMIIFTRFRDLPDEQMRHIVEYVEAGKPIIGMRTATHAFNIPAGKTYAKYGWQSKEWDGGFGRQMLGETWINHHGNHGHESTRGVIAKGAEDDPIVRGCEDIWVPTDVYAVRLPLPGDSKPLVLGQVLSGMNPTDKPVAGPKNNPMMPIAWSKTYKGTQGQTGRVFTTTMGASQDLLSEGLRRLLVNAAYWCVGLEAKIPDRADVDFVGEYKPSPFSFFGKAKARRQAGGSRDEIAAHKPRPVVCADRGLSPARPPVAALSVAVEPRHEIGHHLFPLRLAENLVVQARVEPQRLVGRAGAGDQQPAAAGIGHHVARAVEDQKRQREAACAGLDAFGRAEDFGPRADRKPAVEHQRIVPERLDHGRIAGDVSATQSAPAAAWAKRCWPTKPGGEARETRRRPRPPRGH